MDESERIRREVADTALRLHEATRRVAALSGRKEFLRELREKGNWLANGPAESPAWVRKWDEYWDGLKTNKEYVRFTEEARAAHEALHTSEFEAALERLQNGDASRADYAIAYLEADPWYFQSGYLKGHIARWLRQAELSSEQQERLRTAILASLERGTRFEQSEYRKLARRIETPEFRHKLGELAKSEEPGLAHRAELMLKFCELNDTKGRDLRGAR